MDREKYLKVLEASQQMLEDTANEMVAVKKNNPKRDIADGKHIIDIQKQIDMQFSNEGVQPPKSRTKRSTTQQKQPSTVPPQSVVKNNSQTDKYTADNPYYNFESEKNQNVLNDGVPKRALPESDKKILDELQKQAEIRPNRNYEVFTPPPASRRKYDVIPLPSKGACYPHKKGKLPIFYLTAREEDLITSFNLYKNGLLIDAILKSTMADPDIDPDTLIQADIDAIILFLRATAYGPEFPIVARNPKNDTTFETSISLSQIKYKDCDLKGDEWGWFDYTTSDGDLIKWTIPNRADDRMFEKMVSDVEKRIQTFKLSEMVDDLRLLGKVGFEEITQNDLLFFDNTCNKLEIIKNKLYNGNQADFYSDVLTTKMSMVIMSINGEMDRQYVKEYVYNMRAGEARKFRQHIDANVPSLNYEIEVTIPEGHEGAGETFKTNLSIDDTIFWNILD